MLLDIKKTKGQIWKQDYQIIFKKLKICFPKIGTFYGSAGQNTTLT